MIIFPKKVKWSRDSFALPAKTQLIVVQNFSWKTFSLTFKDFSRFISVNITPRTVVITRISFQNFFFFSFLSKYFHLNCFPSVWESWRKIIFCQFDDKLFPKKNSSVSWKYEARISILTAKIFIWNSYV